MLAIPSKETAVLAGGTDLVGLMKRMVVTPGSGGQHRRDPLAPRHRSDAEGNVWIGAAVHLDEFLATRRTRPLRFGQTGDSRDQQHSTAVSGDADWRTLAAPNCWYFRDGHGLLAKQGTMVIEGAQSLPRDSGKPRSGQVRQRVATGPSFDFARCPPAGDRPRAGARRFHRFGGSVSHPDFRRRERECPDAAANSSRHLILPPHGNRISSAYEVRHGEGPDPPLAAAAVSLDVRLGRVQEARIVLGQVAPVPWVAAEAAAHFVGKSITEESAEQAGAESVAGAIALSENEYKIQLAQVAVKRAILRAAGWKPAASTGPCRNVPSNVQPEPTPLV